MDNRFLIAHKVRGEPAFDVAERVECAECNAQGCAECDQSGHWWVIPTSGHRAYPVTHWALSDLRFGNGEDLPIIPPAMPPNLPDHYTVRASKHTPAAQPPSGLAALLASARKASLPTINRRGF